MSSKFPNSKEFNAFVNQLIRCSSTFGANYRASQRAKSPADFIYKLKIVEKETDESHYFLELLSAVNKKQELKFEIEKLLKESRELLSSLLHQL